MSRIILACGVCALLAVPAVALGKSNTLNGKATNGDANATVSLTVKLNKKGVATKVSKVSYKNVDYSCLGSDPDAKNERSGSVAGSGKLTKEGKSYRFYFKDADGNNVGGLLNKKGTKLTEGNLIIKFKNAGNSCSGQVDFTAAK